MFQLIKELFEKFEQACYLFNGMECWSVRELQEIFNYTGWRNFHKVAEKAKEACSNSGEDIADHFVDVNKMIELGKGAQRNVEDIALTRYARHVFTCDYKGVVISILTYFLHCCNLLCRFRSSWMLIPYTTISIIEVRILLHLQ
jgi:hypothetical protein